MAQSAIRRFRSSINRRFRQSLHRAAKVRRREVRVARFIAEDGKGAYPDME
jgi:hypothetical protein